jgi:sugar/nucleoside kinase (ribokinase family)
MCSHATEAECISEIFLKGVQLLIVTAGAHGSRVYTPEQQFMIPGIAVEAVDVTGAGDTFASAFIHAYHQAVDPHQAALFATAAAARSVTIFGARGGAVSWEEIVRFMKESGI